MFADADLDAAAQGAVVGSFMNAGQDCTASTRIYVQREVRDSFLAKFVGLASTLIVGMFNFVLVFPFFLGSLFLHFGIYVSYLLCYRIFSCFWDPLRFTSPCPPFPSYLVYLSFPLFRRLNNSPSYAYPAQEIPLVQTQTWGRSPVTHTVVRYTATSLQPSRVASGLLWVASFPR